MEWSQAWRGGPTWPGCPQLHHGLRTANLVLRHALVYTVILGPHADQPQCLAGQPQPMAGGEGDSIAQPHDGGLGVPSHLTGELGALAPGNDLLGQLHGDLRWLCAGEKAGLLSVTWQGGQHGHGFVHSSLEGTRTE